MNITRSFVLPLALTAGLLACTEKKAEAPAAAPKPTAAAPVSQAPAPAATPAAAAPAAAAPAADPVAEAAEIFKTRCSTCHGMEGKGDGPASAALNPKPRQFGDKEWQKSVTDEHIEKIIIAGGAAVGKSPLMPPNPDLEGKKDVVAALRAAVRKYGQ
ncbi:MAG: cytochrome c [Myxococcota bacterium]